MHYVLVTACSSVLCPWRLDHNILLLILPEVITFWRHLAALPASVAFHLIAAVLLRADLYLLHFRGVLPEFLTSAAFHSRLSISFVLNVIHRAKQEYHCLHQMKNSFLVQRKNC